MSVSVAFVDDDPILLEALVSLYSGKNDLEIVAKGENAVDALKIVEEILPHVLVLDLSIRGDPMAVIERIGQNFQATRIIVFTENSNVETAIQLLNHGVAGYVLKRSSADELHEAIRVVHDGGTFITAGLATKVMMAMKNPDLCRHTPEQEHLSSREEQILSYLLRGSTNREIAACLDISVKTVKHYMTALMQKLGARNRVEVVLAAQRLNVFADAGGNPGVSRRLN